MHIIMTIGGNEICRKKIEDHLLVNVEGYSPQQNYEARKFIISMFVKQMKSERFKLLAKSKDVEFWLSFQSSMNTMTEDHLDLLNQMEDSNLIF
jgi:hypothetical protein